MSTIDRTIASRELRADLSEVVSRVSFNGQRVAVTRNGSVAAVLISKEDFDLLERFETERDLAEYRDARAQDDGTRVSLDELTRELA